LNTSGTTGHLPSPWEFSYLSWVAALIPFVDLVFAASRIYSHSSMTSCHRCVAYASKLWRGLARNIWVRASSKNGKNKRVKAKDIRFCRHLSARSNLAHLWCAVNYRTTR